MTLSTENFDRAEIAKFEALAANWWNPNAEFKSLHDINPLRLDWIIKQARGLDGKRVLDVGCGAGILSEAMARQAKTVKGIDMGEAPLAAGRLHAAQQGMHNVEYQHVSVEQLAKQEAAQYDVVTCMEMLEHVPDPASVVRACAALVRPGGVVVFSTLNRNPKSYLFAILGAEYILRLLPRGTHDYSKFITPKELQTAIGQVGLNLTDQTGLHYNPLTKKYWLGPDTSVNYMMAAQKSI